MKKEVALKTQRAKKTSDEKRQPSICKGLKKHPMKKEVALKKQGVQKTFDEKRGNHQKARGLKDIR
jgi:hypothetical protein